MNLVILPRLITRGFVKMHPEWNFVHGHDVQKKGMFGQASIYNEENTFPLPVMYKFCASGARYFTDGDKEARKIVMDTIENLPKDKPIIVLRRIGTGCSRMHELAPYLYKEMTLVLDSIKAANYGWDLFYESSICVTPPSQS